MERALYGARKTALRARTAVSRTAFHFTPGADERMGRRQMICAVVKLRSAVAREGRVRLVDREDPLTP